MMTVKPTGSAVGPVVTAMHGICSHIGLNVQGKVMQRESQAGPKTLINSGQNALMASCLSKHPETANGLLQTRSLNI